MPKLLKKSFTLAYASIDKSAEKIDSSNSHATAQKGGEEIEICESAVISLKKSLYRIRLCEDGNVVTLH